MAEPGTRLDGDQLLQLLGTGGMGEVWLARDTGLDRKVALKLLPQDFTHDERRVARFEQEARAASALSHPNICHVYALGQTATGQRYIAMELVEGMTLRERLQAGRLRLAEALKIASQIAAALSAAHAAGIVHRDLKPENVIVRADGLVKVLDFGLAKLSQLGDGGTPSDESTHTVLRTDAGTVLGTVAYMSPEQARGQALDTRTDIWSLGVMLYEAVAGRRPFGGEATTEILAAILEHDAEPLARFELQTPEELQRIVSKSLRKERSQRYQTLSDFALDLEALRDHLYLKEKTGSGPVASRVEPAIGKRRAIWAALAAVAGVGAVGAWAVLHKAIPTQSPHVSVQRTLTRLTFNESGFATLSPDGGRIVFGEWKDGRASLRVQSTTGGNAVELTKSPSDGFPDWSPDGNSIAFARGNAGILVASQLGGQERRVAPFGEWPRWSPDGTNILFSTDSFGPKFRLFLTPTDQPFAQSPRQVLVSFFEGGSWQVANWHPDGRITIAGRHRTEGFGIFTISVQDGRWRMTTIPNELLKESNINPEQIWPWCWAPSARFLYATCLAGGVMNVWRLELDASLHVTSVDRLTNGPGSDWAASISRDGRRLQFTAITGNSRLWSFPLDQQSGKVGAGQPLSEPDGEVNWTSLSPDGRRLAYFYEPLNGDLRQSELRLLSLPFTGTSQTIPADGYVRMASAWSHKGDRLALQGAELSGTGTVVANALIIREHDGREHVVARCESNAQLSPCRIAPLDWTQDDSAVLASSVLGDEKTARLSLWPVSVNAPSVTPRTIVVSDAQWNISQANYSPDGTRLAFAYGAEFGDEKGIAVVPASGHVPRTEWHSIAEGFKSLGNPRWSPDGLMLYFTSSGSSLHLAFPDLWRVGVAPSTGAQVGDPAQVKLTEAILARSYYPTIAIGGNRVLVPLNSQHLSVWMLDNVDR